MINKIAYALYWILSLPALLAGLLRQIAIWIATERWYLWGFIPFNAGLWWLGWFFWNNQIERWYYRIPLRILSYPCFVIGTFLCFRGLWPLTGILLFIRFLIWFNHRARLGDPLVDYTPKYPSHLFHHPLDKLSLLFTGVVFLVFAINKDRLIDFTDPSDHFYHMAVAQKILERGTIPVWDDWEFAPVGRPHLYPPVIHLLIALFAGSPDRIVSGFSTVQMLLYPGALLVYWLLFRTLLSPAHAYLSLLFMSMEFMFTMGCMIGLPASLVNLMWPLILLALLKKKTYTAMLLLAAAFYTHTGMPVLIALGLFVFGIWKREYFFHVTAIVLGAFILAVPWTMRYFIFSDWMQPGGAQGWSLESILSRLLWLQILNPIFLVLTIWGWFRFKNVALLKAPVLGFLPMLTQYGGRFFMHGAPFLSPFIAVHFKRFLEGNVTRRRAVLFLLMTLIPLPCINFMGSNDSIKISPFPGITATHLCLFFTVNRTPKDYSEQEALIRMLRNTTSPADILHLPDDGMYHFGDYLTVMTGRYTDMGGWGEIRKPYMLEAIQQSREDPNDGVFVSKHLENIPESRRIEECGPFFIGYPPDSD